jgi:hypothetical protein
VTLLTEHFVDTLLANGIGARSKAAGKSPNKQVGTCHDNEDEREREERERERERERDEEERQMGTLIFIPPPSPPAQKAEEEAEADAPVDLMDEKHGAASEDDADLVAEVRRLVGQVINHPVSESV